MYRVTKVTLIRDKEGQRQKDYSFPVNEQTSDIEAYRKNLKEKFSASLIHLEYLQKEC